MTNMQVKFAQEYTYWTAAVTVTYPKGFEGEIPTAHANAARKAGKLEGEGDGDGNATAGAPGRAGKAEK
jgi:hypothetical protein